MSNRSTQHYDYHGWARRIDLVFRAHYPNLTTRIPPGHRGGDGRYYCRRSDGTTGLVIGALLGHRSIAAKCAAADGLL